MNSGNPSRQEQIVLWLAKTPAVGIPVRSGPKEGFFVNRGTIFKLKNGEQVEALDWLDKEGIRDSMTIAGYRVVYQAAGAYGEKLTFFKDAVASAPF